MLISFAATNFRSIRERTEISLRKSGLSGLKANVHQTDKQNGFLKSAVIFGPNASGKSNLLRAMAALHFLVARSSKFKTEQEIVPYEPNKLDMESVKKPVVLEISFIAGNIRYDYSISYLQKKILTEELSFYPHKVKSLLYHRSEQKELKYGEYYKGDKKSLEKLVQDNQLFLSKAAENNPESLKDPFMFITEHLKIYPLLDVYEINELGMTYIQKIAENKDSAFSKIFNKLIYALNSDIKEVKAELNDWSGISLFKNFDEEVINEFKKRHKYDVKIVHSEYSGKIQTGYNELRLYEESKGTQLLFIIAGIILDTLISGSVLVIDEFETNLHPVIARYLIKLFHNPLTNPDNAQLIFATHDISQLSGDTFRRDQVWFTEKDAFGGTRLTNCAKIGGIRLNVPLDKWYSAGKLGATPLINDIDFLIEMQDNESPL